MYTNAHLKITDRIWHMYSDVCNGKTFNSLRNIIQYADSNLQEINLFMATTFTASYMYKETYQ